ncbi:hypothetical protein OsJ_20850 [Oryza sativa Japonica Group]|uniref:EF-hand domain-containing protein n=1 Tax=Oryza sativa subsp. japonica TaxID=39947 RepID=A3BAC6_ORYSJ|nr:hypothetical protein OsJ_20850 [Oryza sativa Japonica Group]
MRAQRPSLAAAGNPVLALLFLWVLSWGHVTAEIDIANMTALQKHVSFFDRNKDGIITPSETIEGVVAIGCDFAFARDLAASVHAGLGPKTSPGKIDPVLFPHSNAQKDAPLPHLSIYINNIYRGMHRSDTGALDAKGRFVPAKFEEIFSKHAKNRPDALTSLEVKEMILANRDPNDPQSCYPITPRCLRHPPSTPFLWPPHLIPRRPRLRGGKLPLFLDLLVHDWEIDRTVISASHDFFGLTGLEEDHAAHLFIHVRDALEVEAVEAVPGDALVDLFADGSMLP